MAIYNAVFRINQERTGGSTSYGDPGISRRDLWVTKRIHLVPNSPPVELGTTFFWEFLDRPRGSSVVMLDESTGLPSQTSQLVRFDPDVWGTYRIRLTINKGQYTHTMLAAVILSSTGTTMNRGWRFPAFKEIDTEGNFPGQLRGYADDWDTILTDLMESAAPDVTFTQVKNALAGATTAVDFNSKKLTGVADPADLQDVATKNYADNLAQGLKPKGSVKAIAITAIALLEGLAETVDDVPLDTDGMRVLLTQQGVGGAPHIDNGIWVVHAAAWTRSTDFAAGMHVAGAYAFAEQGTVRAHTGWVCTADGPADVVGTDVLGWTQFSALAVTFAGDLSGTLSSQSVIALRGHAVASTAPTNNQVLRWKAGLLISQWEPQDIINRYTFDLAAGENTTDVGSTTPLVIGATYFDPNAIVPAAGGQGRLVTFKAILETSDIGHAANIDLYDVNGITNGGTPTVIAASAMSSVSLPPQYVEVSLTLDLGAVTTAGILECRLWVSDADLVNVATCKMAKIDVTWDAGGPVP